MRLWTLHPKHLDAKGLVALWREAASGSLQFSRSGATAGFELARGELVARAQAHPETGTRQLAAIWNLITERAEFLFKDSRSADGARHARPKLLPPAPEKPRAKAAPERRAAARLG